jgi:hypothetical protein
VRGVCEVWGASDALGAPEFKAALAEGASAAYRAVKEPVEGTMLTVIREMAAAAQGVPDSFALDKMVVVVEEAGRVAVEKTTGQLAALQKAGVVDAGGYGLLVLFPASPPASPRSPTAARPSTARPWRCAPEPRRP